MARYIDADELYKATQKRIAEANEARMAVVDDEFLDLINDAFTEDVAPRAEAVIEVFKAFGVLIPENTILEEAVESYKKTQKIIRNMAIANAKADVAREIFEDIREKGKFNEPIVDYVCLSFEELAEIEKKYTGAETEPPKESKR